MEPPPPSFFSRVVLALSCFFRLLFDPGFAARVLKLASAGEPAASPSEPQTPEPPAVPEKDDSPALALLAAFQREGRLVDFLEQDVEAFPDADIGAAARVVHAGCRKALRAHVPVERVRKEAEGSTVTVEAADVRAVNLTGNVRGEAPYRGTLRHSGWRATSVTLPEGTPGHDERLLFPAEVEL
ncbi:MAG TPA: DUF2760 domain-containing protein [Polyangiaceae bacterium]|nr:DUF2760 domain-containing protein [Polyangiaceae bacterium]